ncbi:hypothetical protein [Bradyrhizobium aeschynomenes]|uniref:hypothetical protein n=1 Tax=Bradyrhizobium aeschynomenes TaxID=2734909 RepID=UPI0015582247|nr:hypothetical protein [Bradyrhizobium aeschynomenes]NPV19287.1 hypothetical protein [Bradyrhizobium aeschynomenes]
MVEKCTICLVGPKSAGKSSLLQTLVDCVELAGHGFSSDYGISLRDIDEAEYSDGQAVSRILGGSSGNYRDYRSDFFHVQVQTDSTIEFYFRLTVDVQGATRGESQRISKLLRVVDSAGEYAVVENYGGGRIDNPTESVNKLNDALMEAEATIIVIPLVDMEKATFVGPLTNLIAQLVKTSDQKPSRIVVAFTQYEKLFVRAGRDAFAAACQPEVAEGVIRRALGQGQWAADLKRFAKKPNKQVYLTVTSSYGFARGLGIPNIDPHWPAEMPSEQLIGKPDDIAAYWRPFLTADPFITAAIDHPGELTFTFEALFPEEHEGLGEEQVPYDPEPQPEVAPVELTQRRPKNGWLKDKLNWFNRNRPE